MENENGEQLIQCLECGKIFDRGFRTRQKFCCKKCRLEYNKHDEEYKERARIKRHARWRKRKTLYCLMCGQPIDRAENGTGSSRMHDQCIIDDALSTLRAGNTLSSTQVSRIHAYGHTVTEMVDVICKEIDAAKKPKNIISKDTAVEKYQIAMPTLNSLISDDKIRIYNKSDYGKNDSQRRIYVDASELEVYIKKRNVNRKNKLKEGELMKKPPIRNCDFCGKEVTDYPGYHICRDCTIEMLYNAYYNHYKITERTYARVKVYQIDLKEIRKQARADKKKVGK